MQVLAQSPVQTIGLSPLFLFCFLLEPILVCEGIIAIVLKRRSLIYIKTMILFIGNETIFMITAMGTSKSRPNIGLFDLGPIKLFDFQYATIART